MSITREQLTPKAALADVLLKSAVGVKRFIVTRRMRTKPLAWDAIADKIAAETDGRVMVTGTSVQAWVSDADFARSIGPAVAS